MFDKLLTNKYFCIAIIVALIVVLILYCQKSSCGLEGMQNVDLTPLGQELAEAPWTNEKGGDEHKMVNNNFDKYADKYTKNKLHKKGYSYTNFLKRSDDNFRKYISEEEYGTQEHYARVGDDSDDKKTIRLDHDNVPRPMDTHPELSQCQPCKCPQDKLMATDDDIDFSETEPDTETLRRRRYLKKRKYHRK